MYNITFDANMLIIIATNTQSSLIGYAVKVTLVCVCLCSLGEVAH